MRHLFPDLSGGTDPAQFAASKLVEEAVFGANPGALRLFRHLPGTLPRNAPLLVMLHGCGQTARGYDHGAGWSVLADRHKFALLAPEQSRANNPKGCFNWFHDEDTMRGSGEAASIAGMIVHMVDSHGIDPKRIFITGLSAGGAMASSLLAAYPEIFAGGALIAGLPAGSASSIPEALMHMRRPQDRMAAQWGDEVRRASPHTGPWPRISVWHGDADHVVAEANMEAIIAQWRDVHGLKDAPKEEQQPGWSRRVWHDARKMPVIEAYIVKGLGHGTPITDGKDGGHAAPFILDSGISSSARIADFFGLASPTDVPRPAAARTARPEPVRVENSAAAPPRRTPLSPMQKVRQTITAALKTAGLIKRR